jgi:sugar phosphate isomerase/epimerase
VSLRIGNQTARTADTALQPFAYALDHGFSAFEFFPDRGDAGGGGWHEDDLDPAARRWVRRRAAAQDLELTVHAPLEFDPLRDPDDPRIERTAAFARDIGATLLNLHLDLRQGLHRFATALAPTLRLAAQAGLRLGLENTVHTGPEDFNRFFATLRAEPSSAPPCVGMTFDLGHANLFPPLRHDYCRYLDLLAPDLPILHLHIHENYGDSDSHLPLFTGPSRDNPAGPAGMLDRLARRGFAGCAILEQWPQPPELLDQARDRLRALWAERCPTTPRRAA